MLPFKKDFQVFWCLVQEGWLTYMLCILVFVTGGPRKEWCHVDGVPRNNS